LATADIANGFSSSDAFSDLGFWGGDLISTNGTQEEIPVRARVPHGGHTRAVNLPGERRIIQSVDLWYGKGRWSKRPKVSLYGIR
jgi:hypothetical protein